VWLDQVFAVNLPIKTPADLRCWCRMQLEGLEQLADAYPVGFCSAGRRWLFDWDLLQEAGRLLPDPDAGTSTCLAEFYGRLKEVCCTTPPPGDASESWLADYFCHETAIREEMGIRPPKGPSAEDFQMLVQRAWGYIHRIARKAGSSPPEEPEPVSDAESCRSVLHQVVAWCQELENNQTSQQAASKKIRTQSGGSAERDFPLVGGPNQDDLSGVPNGPSEVAELDEGRKRWLTVSEAEKVSSIPKGTISKAASNNELLTNGKKGRGRRIDALDLNRWKLARSSKPEREESDDQVQKLVNKHVRD
jgi:hypothetical protein